MKATFVPLGKSSSVTFYYLSRVFNFSWLVERLGLFTYLFTSSSSWEDVSVSRPERVSCTLRIMKQKRGNWTL